MVLLKVLRTYLISFVKNTFLLICNMLLCKEFIILIICRMSVSLKLGGDIATYSKAGQDMTFLIMNSLMSLDRIWILVLVVLSGKELLMRPRN